MTLTRNTSTVKAVVVVSTKTSKSIIRSSHANHFPTQLHDLLDDAERKGHTHIVSWNEDDNGKSFTIHPSGVPHLLVPLLQQYFRQTKYKSFIRQLQGYDFTRITRGADKGRCSHPQFQRRKWSQSVSMRRKPAKKSTAASSVGGGTKTGTGVAGTATALAPSTCTVPPPGQQHAQKRQRQRSHDGVGMIPVSLSAPTAVPPLMGSSSSMSSSAYKNTSFPSSSFPLLPPSMGLTSISSTTTIPHKLFSIQTDVDHNYCSLNQDDPQGRCTVNEEETIRATSTEERMPLQKNSVIPQHNFELLEKLCDNNHTSLNNGSSSSSSNSTGQKNNTDFHHQYQYRPQLHSTNNNMGTLDLNISFTTTTTTTTPNTNKSGIVDPTTKKFHEPLVLLLEPKPIGPTSSWIINNNDSNNNKTMNDHQQVVITGSSSSSSTTTTKQVPTSPLCSGIVPSEKWVDVDDGLAQLFPEKSEDSQLHIVDSKVNVIVNEQGDTNDVVDDDDLAEWTTGMVYEGDDDSDMCGSSNDPNHHDRNTRMINDDPIPLTAASINAIMEPPTKLTLSESQSQSQALHVQQQQLQQRIHLLQQLQRVQQQAQQKEQLLVRVQQQLLVRVQQEQQRRGQQARAQQQQQQHFTPVPPPIGVQQQQQQQLSHLLPPQQLSSASVSAPTSVNHFSPSVLQQYPQQLQQIQQQQQQILYNNNSIIRTI